MLLLRYYLVIIVLLLGFYQDSGIFILESESHSTEISGPDRGIYLVKVFYRWLDPNRLTFFGPADIDNDNDNKSSMVVVSDQLISRGLCLYKFEYHIIYSSSYQVPVLYFNICDCDGSSVSLEWLWRRIPEQVVARSLPDQNPLPEPTDHDQLYAEFGRTITQTMHPISGAPCFMVHPCHTASMMGQTMTQCDPSQDDDQLSSSSAHHSSVLTNSSVYLITWLSSLCNLVGLSMPLEYGHIR